MIHKYQYKYKTNLWFPFLLCLGFLLHTAEFYFSLWLLPQLLHWELTAGAVTGPWAALFAQGKAGYTQSSFGSIGLRSSIGNVRWLLGRCSAYSLMPFLLQRCVKTEPKAAPWLLFGLVCVAGPSPGRFPRCFHSQFTALVWRGGLGIGVSALLCRAGALDYVLCSAGCVPGCPEPRAQLPFRKRKKHCREWREKCYKAF